MKTLVILVLVLALAALLFLTRPTKADFEKYVRENSTIVNGKPTGGPTIADTIGDKLRTFSAASARETKSPADLYLEQCTFENRFLWTNVKREGKLVYTGAVNHWFERGAGS
jgi:hypothetical protein